MQVQTRLLNERQVAEMLGCSVQTLRNARAQGRSLAYCKLGRSVRYVESDVLGMIEAKKVIPRQERS